MLERWNLLYEILMSHTDFHKKIWNSIEAFTIYTAFGGHKRARRTLVNVMMDSFTLDLIMLTSHVMASLVLLYSGIKRLTNMRITNLAIVTFQSCPKQYSRDAAFCRTIPTQQFFRNSRLANNVAPL